MNCISPRRWKPAILLATLLFAAGNAWVARAAFVPLETFSSLAEGPINGQNGWVANATAAAVATDPTAPTNKVLSLYNSTSADALKLLGNLTITNGTTGTVFYRFRRADSQMNISHGLSDLAAFTSPRNFGDFEAQLQSNGTNPPALNARDGTVFRPVATFAPDVWYSIWMVVNNATDLYSIYLLGGIYTTQTLVTAGTEYAFTFRNTGGDGANANSSPVANNLVSIMARSSGNSNHVGPFFLDDIYVDVSGANLSNPVADTNAPIVASIAPTPGTTVQFLASIKVTFNEGVTNVAATDLRINNSPATNVTGAGAVWTFAFPQPPEGAVSVAWAPGQNIADLFNNRFAGTNTWSYLLLPPDQTPPAIGSVNPAANSTLTNWDQTQIVVTFTEPVTGVNATDLRVGGMPALAVTNSGNAYFFTAAQPAPGVVTNFFAAGHGIADLSGNSFNENLASHRWSYTFNDTTPPFLTAVTPEPGSAVTRFNTVEVTFNETVSGVSAADLLINGSPVTGVTGTGAGPYRFSFPQPPVGTVQIGWAAGHGIADVSANTFTGGGWTNTLEFAPIGFALFEKFDNLTPGAINGQNGWVTASAGFQVGTDPANATNKVLAAPAMSEAPLVKALGVLSLSNSATGTVFFRMRRGNAALNISVGASDLASPTSGFGDYESQINCNTTGANNLNVRDAGVFDAVDTFASDTWYSVWMVIDNARDLTSVFMQGGALANQTLLNGNTDGETAFTFRNSTGDALNSNTGPQPNALITFLVRIGGSHTGPLYVDDIYVDPLAANLSNPLGPDTLAPTLVQAQPAPGANLYSFDTVTVSFSEPVQNVAAANLLINGVPATQVNGAWQTWTFNFPQPATGTVLVAWASDQNIRDFAGNRFNHTNATWAYTLSDPDVTAPWVAAASPAPGATVSTWSQVQVTFNEPVAGVEAAALLVNGAPATAVTNSGDAYFFTAPTPLPGLVAVTFDPGRAITDLSGNLFNPDQDSNRWTFTFVDAAPPLVVVITPAPGATVTRIDAVEVQFNEAVSGVAAADLLINGSPATNVTGAGSGPYRFSFPPPELGLAQFAWAEGHGITDLNANAFAGGSWTNTIVSPDALSNVIINEFLANNVKGLANEFGEAEDWIELYNAGATAVNLLGWSLTDDERNPDLWTFPDLTLQPGQYLVVFADARNLKTYGGTNRLHTNFKINDQGDYLALFNADFPRTARSAFNPQFPEQRADYSFGLTLSNTWRYFAVPTPGGPNGDSTIAGVAPIPHVSAGRGLYDHPFTLVASCALPEATLRYTTDGSQPTELNGITYAGPFVISNTTIFRLAAFATNLLPSRVSTHSYLFTDQVLVQPNNPAGYPVGTNVWTGYPSDYEMDPEIVNANPAFVRASLMALPTLSIAIPVDDLFGSANGIYTHPEASPRELWERACSAEFILTNGQTGFQVDCGIRVQGNASRTPQKTPKHPFRLFFRGAYGPGKLDYPLFADSPVQSFNTIVLRADFNTSWLHWHNQQRAMGTRVRDAWTKNTFRAMTGTASHSRPFHLYLNGIYWGVYDFGERIDAEWAASYFGGSPEEWDAIASKPTEAIDGTLAAYNDMVSLGRSADMTQPANYLAVQQRLDLPVFIDYMALNFYGANVDWGYNGNWNAVYRRVPGGKFKYAVWDGELVAIATNDNRVTADLGGYGIGANQGLPSGLHTNLTKSAQYRLDFADRVHKHCFNNGVLTPTSASAQWMQRAREVEPGMLAESARWGDYRRDVHQYSSGPYELYRTNTHWWPEIERMRTTYFPVRTDIFLNQLRSAGLYPTIAAPTFSQHGGRVPRDYALTMTATNAIYYTTNGSDPRALFTGAIADDAHLYTEALSLTSSLLVKARTLDGTNWSALNEAWFEVDTLGVQLHFTEIMYNPVGSDGYEFLELRNDGPSPLDVSGWSFEGISYVFSSDSVLAPGQLIVLANSANPDAFAARYPGVSVFGYFNGRLDNGGERVALRDGAGRIVLSVDYRDDAGWPKAADGDGYSLEVVDAFADPDAASNWQAASINGTPGTTLPVPAVGVVRISEIMADNLAAVENGGTFPDWIELHNASGTDVELAGWSLSDDSGARKYVLPDGTVLPAGGYLVLWCDTNSSLPGLHTGFSLDRNGETVSLFNSATSRIDALTYGLQVTDFTVSRIGSDWLLTLPTPGTSNVAAATASPTNLVINEWLANAPPGGSDWIELFNSATNPVPLRGLWVAQSNSLHQLQSLSFLGAQDHLQLLADEQSGLRHLDFKLPSEGGTILLYDNTAVEFARVNYGAQMEMVSEGLLPDASRTVTNFVLSPSPGASNYVVAYTGPRLNEVMAVNHSAVTNSRGATPDWIELYNPLDNSFDLGGFRLSTAFGNPSQWIFPAGTIIPANGHLMIWFDDGRPASVQYESELNTGRSLDGDSDEVYLFNADGLVVDSVEFGLQAANWSIGRLGDAWELLAIPTPGAANSAPALLGNASALLINEWLAASAGQDDFIELFNADALPVALSGLHLTDDLSAPGLTKFQMAPLSFIAPLGFAEFKADGDPSRGRNHVNFSLDSNAESLRLSSPTLGVLDTIAFGLQVDGTSEGRQSDGAAGFVPFACPTPGWSNALASSIVIATQPRGQSVLPGSSAKFSVEALGGGQLTFQWYFSGAAIGGATNATLELVNVQSQQAGLYWVAISNACAANLSDPALLTVTAPFTGAARVTWANGQPEVAFEGIPNATYIIQRTDSLASPVWSNVATQQANGLGWIIFTDADAPQTNGFYRAVWP